MRTVLPFLALVLLASSASAFYEANSPVVSLTSEDFEEKVLKSDEAWIVEFYAPWCGHCKSLTPEWEAAAKALAKSSPGVKLAAVDAEKDRELGSKYGVQGFPTIKIFGYDKETPKDYEGGRQQADIIHAAKHELLNLQASKEAGKDTVVDAPEKERVASAFYGGSDVVDLYDDNFESEIKASKAGWLVEFYAPWCGHCKQLSPTWKELATEMGGSVNIAAVDAEANSAVGRKFGISGFPTIKFFPPGSLEAEEYQGGRTLQHLTEFCNKKAEEYPTGTVEVTQFKDDADLQERCLNRLLCVTFILPHLMDTGVEGRNKYIETTVEVAKKFRGKKVGFGWIGGGDHYDFEERFGVSANYPTFVAIGAKKAVYSKLHGKFEAQTMIASINKLLGQRPAFHQIAKIPQLDSGIALWDGKEYVPPQEEDY